jgi:molybdopterin converting factor subunit 1
MRVLFFSQLRDLTGCREVELPGAGLDEDGLWQRLSEAYPELGRYRPVVRLARNHEYASAQVRFEEGDEVALIPPVSGG